MKIKVCENQPKPEFANDKKRGMIMYVTTECIEGNTKFDQV